MWGASPVLTQKGKTKKEVANLGSQGSFQRGTEFEPN